VPQDPAAWDAPKLVFRDISERPTFWMDLEGSVVNGDCYWITADKENKEDLLWLAAAVANSKFIEAFYDHRFNNKLYAGRRRFMKQYVEEFPLPDPQTGFSREIVRMTKEIYASVDERPTVDIESKLNAMIWQTFGLGVKESTW
jgi:adenine-specific DNA-methyltransferase